MLPLAGCHRHNLVELLQQGVEVVRQSDEEQENYILQLLAKPCYRDAKLLSVFGYGAAGNVVAFFF